MIKALEKLSIHHYTPVMIINQVNYFLK